MTDSAQQNFDGPDKDSNLADIMCEIDDLVQQHSQRESKDWDSAEENENPAPAVLAPVSLNNDRIKPSSAGWDNMKPHHKAESKENSSPAPGHYRGISFGVNAGVYEKAPESPTECVPAPQQQTAPREVVPQGRSYVRLLEENNETLKRNNEALIQALGEKDKIVCAHKMQNAALIKQNVMCGKREWVVRTEGVATADGRGEQLLKGEDEQAAVGKRRIHYVTK